MMYSCAAQTRTSSYFVGLQPSSPRLLLQLLQRQSAAHSAWVHDSRLHAHTALPRLSLESRRHWGPLQGGCPRLPHFPSGTGLIPGLFASQIQASMAVPGAQARHLADCQQLICNSYTPQVQTERDSLHPATPLCLLQLDDQSARAAPPFKAMQSY
eukprot:366206-Chlamydomonas_euryale.AAC.1